MRLDELVEFNPRVSIKKGTNTPFVPMDRVEPFARTVTAAQTRPFTSGARFLDGDTIMARITPSLENGKTSIYRSALGEEELPAFGSTEFIVARAKLGVSDSLFVYYLLTSNEIRDVAIASMTGSSGRQRVQLDQLKDYEGDFPSLEVQQKIGHKLGSLDDKIESNQRQIELLQQLSRAHFLLWKQTSQPRSEVTFGDLCEVLGGTTPSTKVPENWEGELDWLTPSDVTALSSPYIFESSRKITEVGRESKGLLMHPAGTIFMTSRATIGEFALSLRGPMTTNQGFIVVKPTEDYHRWFLFEEMRSRVDEFHQFANGSTFLELSRGKFKQLPVGVYDDDELQSLDRILMPLQLRSEQLAFENRKLKLLRDSLLPELLSGRITPEQLEAGL